LSYQNNIANTGRQEDVVDKYLLDKLQSILLQDERKQLQDLVSHLHNLRLDVEHLSRDVTEIKGGVFTAVDSINNPSQFESKVSPLINMRVQQLKKNFQQEFGYEVKETVKEELEASRDEFIEVLYPIIGKLVQRYVRYQFDIFLENVQKGIGNTFSWKWWKQALTTFITGESMAAKSVKAAMPTQIEEVFVIQTNSGLLLGYYSRSNTTDPDLIAAMLTAIQNFVSDAFKKDSGNLQTIDHENQRIFLHNFYKHYTATVVSGIADTAVNEKLYLALSDFSSKNVPTAITEIDDSLFNGVSRHLREIFEDFDLT